MSARFQTVNKESNERFYKLLEILQTKYEIPLVINTSFNVRGEPIVCTPDDAYDCFMNTEIDYLVIENFIFDKKVQPMYNNLRDFKLNSQLD
jgi:carbamoyltransferase